MPRKKDPKSARNDLDELLDHLPTGNGHDAEGLADAEESGEEEELVWMSCGVTDKLLRSSASLEQLPITSIRNLS